jgi:hypothetical protein
LASRCLEELHGKFMYRLAYEKVVEHISEAVPAVPAIPI